MSTYMQKGDAGVLLDVAVTDPDGNIVSLSGATTQLGDAGANIILGPPTGDAMWLDGTFDPLTSGTDGRVIYATAEDEIDVAGIWNIQVYWEKDGDKRRSTIGTFEVLENIE